MMGRSFSSIIKNAYYFYSLPIYIGIVFRWVVIAKKAKPLEKYVNEIGAGWLSLYNMWFLVFVLHPIWYPDFDMPESIMQDPWFWTSGVKYIGDMFLFHSESRLNSIYEFYEKYPRKTKKKIVGITSFIWVIIATISVVYFYVFHLSQVNSPG